MRLAVFPSRTYTYIAFGLDITCLAVVAVLVFLGGENRHPAGVGGEFLTVALEGGSGQRLSGAVVDNFENLSHLRVGKSAENCHQCDENEGFAFHKCGVLM